MTREHPTYSADIQPLFRPKDQSSMIGSFDLWSYADVAENAEAIIVRLESGDMPCDVPWSEDEVALFRRWLESGKPE
ncbi:hypothetical protein J4H86_24060 [Spiractinospora alimapuensis]|uniref:hypothetical protein n=1 Tax=Spiractinospora alimapuensis TaxID=2820884 RepID=UPI001F451DDD|nr:hypothetical protein [Spiractinospora alimapuensis]QVQ51805.1 hypothetical protein J4H86_24060 [Spiractinospora alimapuensis]